MWMWRAETGLWERDPGAPVGFEGNLLDVAFEPGDPTRGYAVGKEGVLLRYDKTWTQEALPAGYERAHFTSLAFAGTQAIAVAGRACSSTTAAAGASTRACRRCSTRCRAPSRRSSLAAAGLPDGGAVVAGRELVLERDGAESAWRFSDQPLLGLTAVAAAAFRDGDRVARARSPRQPRCRYPLADQLPEPDPSVPPPIVPPYPLARRRLPPARDRRRAGATSSARRSSAARSTARSSPTRRRPRRRGRRRGVGASAAGAATPTRAGAGRRRAARAGAATARASRPPPSCATRRRRRARARRARAPPRRPAGRADRAFAVAGHAQCEEPLRRPRRAGHRPDRIAR